MTQKNVRVGELFETLVNEICERVSNRVSLIISEEREKAAHLALHVSAEAAEGIAKEPPKDDLSATFIDSKRVCKMLGFSKTTLWRLQRAGKFPRARQLTQGRVAWVRSEVEEWSNSLARV